MASELLPACKAGRGHSRLGATASPRDVTATPRPLGLAEVVNLQVPSHATAWTVGLLSVTFMNVLDIPGENGASPL